MVYLIIAAVSASLFSIIMKIGQNLQNDGRHIIFIGYLFGAIVTSAQILYTVYFNSSEAPAAAWEPYILPFKGLMFSLLQGFLFLAGFVLLDISTWRNGVALSTVAARASLILPVIFSWLLLSQPAPVWYPVIMVIVAMALIILPGGFQQHKEYEQGVTTSTMSHLNLSDSEYQARLNKRRRVLAVLVLIWVFLVSGVSDFTLKLVQNSVDSSLGEEVRVCRLNSLTAMIFIMSALLSFIYCLMPGKKIPFKKSNWKTVLAGSALGIVNIACTSCILRALNTIPTHVFFPLYNIFIVIIATLVGVFCFKEKLKWLQIAGLVLAVVAIALTI